MMMMMMMSTATNTPTTYCTYVGRLVVVIVRPLQMFLLDNSTGFLVLYLVSADPGLAAPAKGWSNRHDEEREHHG